MKKTLLVHALAFVLAVFIPTTLSSPTPAGAQAKPVVWNLPHVAAPTRRTIGTRDFTSVTLASSARPTPWAAKTAAVIFRCPKREAIGPNSTRPGSCIAPIQPIVIAAVAIG